MKMQNKLVSIVLSLAMVFTPMSPISWADDQVNSENPTQGPELEKTIEQANLDANEKVKKETVLDKNEHNSFLSGRALSLPISSATQVLQQKSIVDLQKIEKMIFRPIATPVIRPVIYQPNWGYRKISLESKDPLLLEAQKRFGDKVVKGEGERFSFDQPIVYKFYNQEGKVIGQYASGGRQRSDDWTWADGTKHHDLTPFIELYHARVKDLEEIKSGISSEGITLDDVSEFLEVQSQLKGIIEKIRALGVEVPKDLIDGFNSTVSTFDELMGNKPLIIDTEIGKVEVSASELMRYVNEEFKRLIDVKTTDLHRLPGIDVSDLAGLQGFKDYLNARSLNGNIDISIFKGLSPVGNLHLVERLVRKYIATYGSDIAPYDIDNDGLLEINFKDFAASVNGTLPIRREALRRIELIKNEMGVNVPSEGFDNVEDLISMLKKIEDLNEALKESLANLTDGVTLEPVFLSLLKNEVSQTISTTYNNLINQVVNTLSNRENPIKVLQSDAKIVVDNLSAKTFESLSAIALNIDALHVDMKGVVEAINAALPSTSLTNRVNQELNRQLTNINTSLEYQLSTIVRFGNTEFQTIIADLGPQFPAGEMTIEEVYIAIKQMDHLQETLSNKVQDFSKNLNISENFKRQIMQWLDYRAHTYNSGVYDQEHRRFENALRSKTVVFNIEGVGEIRLKAADFNAVAVPTEIASLLRFPGNPFTEEELHAMEKAHSDQKRRSIDFGTQNISETPGFLSSLAMRFQFTEAFLKVNGAKVVVAGSIAQENYRAYRRQLLMNKTLELYFDAAIAAVETSIEEAKDLIGNSTDAISTETYEKLYQLISESNKAATEILQLKLDDVIYEARQMVTNMLQEKFNELLAVVDKVTKPKNGIVTVLVTIDGQEMKVDVRKIQLKIEEVMNRAALKMGNDFTREQLERLMGIEGLAEMMSSYELYKDRQIDFNHRKPFFSRDMNGTIAEEEFWFQLIPSMIAKFGGEIFNSDGELNVNVLETKLTEGAKLPVESGQTIQEELRKARKEIIEATLAELRNINFSVLNERLRGEQLVLEAILKIEALGHEMIQGLNQDEINLLQNEMNQGSTYYGVPSFREVTVLLEEKRRTAVTSMNLVDGKTLKIDMNHLINVIKGLQYSLNYDPELFPGVNPDDFDGAEQFNIPSYNQFKLNKNDVRDGSDFLSSGIDKIRFFANLIMRHYENIEAIPAIYREDLFTENEKGEVVLNFEKFRRYLKGIDALHQQVENQVAAWLEGDEGALAKIEALKVKPMTMDSMMKVFSEIQGLQAKIMDYLNSLTLRHEQEDVMAMEVSLMKIFGRATQSMRDYYQENHLTMVIDGKTITVPVQELNKRLQESLAEKFPNEDDISAHHYASFFGISIEDIRGYQKLSDFLGGQIIALPRNSQYVYVPAKLSGMGLAQMMQDMIKRYADQVVTANGHVNVDKLMQLLSDEDLAVKRAKSRADEILTESMKQLEQMESPLTSSSLDQLHELANYLRLQLVNTMNEHVSGFNQEMFDAIQTHVTALFDQFAEARIEKIMHSAVVINAADGSKFEIDFATLEPEAAGRIIMLLEDMKSKGLNQLDQSKPVKEKEEEVTPVKQECNDEGICLTANIELVPVKYRTMEIFEYAMPVRSSYVSKRQIEYYPYYHPTHVAIDDAGQPTQFDFLKILSRLAVRYGSFVVDDDGKFDQAAFLKALEMTDQERATAQFEKLTKETIEKLQGIVPADANDGITLENIVALHNQLAESKEVFLKTLKGLKESADSSTYSRMVSLVNSKWSAIMNEYEALSFTRDLMMEINGIQVRIPSATIAKILREEFNSGHQELLSSYLEGGEQQYEYNNLKTLEQSSSGGQNVVVDSVQNEYLKDEATKLSFRYPFTFGDLRKIKGINAQDLSDLEAVKHEVRLTLREAEELLKSKLNLRIFAPGSSSVGTANIGASAGDVQMAMKSSVQAMSVQMDSMPSSMQVEFSSSKIAIMPGVIKEQLILTFPIDLILIQPLDQNPIRELIERPDYLPPVQSMTISQRDLLFRVIPALIEDYADLLVKEGTVDLESLRDLIKDSEKALKNREAERILASLKSQTEAFEKAIQSGNANIQTAGLTGLVSYDYNTGKQYLKVYEPLLYRLLMTHTDAETNKLSREIANAEGFDQLMEVTGMSKNELLASKGSDIYQYIPSIDYELPYQIYAHTAVEDSLEAYFDTDIEEQKRYYPLPVKGVNWWQYNNKFVTIDAARFSFEIQNGKAVGKIHQASSVAGIQFAKQAMDLLVSSPEARAAKMARDRYLQEFVFGSEEREKNLVLGGIKQEITELTKALAEGDRNLQAQLSTAGYVRKDAEGYYVEVPEPWDIYQYLLENKTSEGQLKLSAINDEVVEKTNLSRQELVKMPVDQIVAYLPHFKVRLNDQQLYHREATIAQNEDEKMMSLPLDWRPEPNWNQYLNQMISLKGLVSYQLNKKGQLEGSLKSAQGVQTLKHVSQATKIMQSSAESEKAKNLRNRYEEFLNSPVISPRKIIPLAPERTPISRISSPMDLIQYSRDLMERVKKITGRWGKNLDEDKVEKEDDSAVKTDMTPQKKDTVITSFLGSVALPAVKVNTFTEAFPISRDFQILKSLTTTE